MEVFMEIVKDVCVISLSIAISIASVFMAALSIAFAWFVVCGAIGEAYKKFRTSNSEGTSR